MTPERCNELDAIISLFVRLDWSPDDFALHWNRDNDGPYLFVLCNDVFETAADGERVNMKDLPLIEQVITDVESRLYEPDADTCFEWAHLLYVSRKRHQKPWRKETITQLRSRSKAMYDWIMDASSGLAPIIREFEGSE